MIKGDFTGSNSTDEFVHYDSQHIFRFHVRTIQLLVKKSDTVPVEIGKLIEHPAASLAVEIT